MIKEFPPSHSSQCSHAQALYYDNVLTADEKKMKKTPVFEWHRELISGSRLALCIVIVMKKCTLHAQDSEKKRQYLIYGWIYVCVYAHTRVCTSYQGGVLWPSARPSRQRGSGRERSYSLHGIKIPDKLLRACTPLLILFPVEFTKRQL